MARVWCGPCMVWPMYGLAHVWCGPCMVWPMQGGVVGLAAAVVPLLYWGEHSLDLYEAFGELIVDFAILFPRADT